MADNIETQIRKALDHRAHEVDVPVDLMRNTLQAAQESAQPSLRERLRARRDARHLGLPVTGYPRWVYAGAAAAVAALMFVVGSYVTTDPVLDRPVTLDRDGAVTPAQGVPEAFEQTEDGLRVGGAEPAPDIGVPSRPGQVPPGIIPPVPPRPGAFPPQITRTSNLEIEVGSFGRAWDEVNAIARRNDGFVTNAHAGLRRGTITMRVPDARLDDAVAALRRLGRLVEATTTSADVSGSLVDIGARLRAIEAEELQLLELLQRATGVTQILEVRDRLNSVRQEIESLKAQEEFLRNQVEFATIHATVFEAGAPDPFDRGDGIIADAWRTALRVGLTVVAGTVVVAGGLLPLAALGALVWLGVSLIRRRRAA